jgi:hypothetical protein
MNKDKKYLLLKLPYYIGAVADFLWSIALFHPSFFGALTGQENFDPNLRVRLIMGIGAILMLGWTILLLWGAREPITRRFIILLTAFLVFGLLIISIISCINFEGSSTWIIIKTIFLFVIMIASYLMANKDVKKHI